jgi:hypothetical protein
MPLPKPPRPPAFSHGTTSFAWAIFFGLFVFVGMLSISIDKGTSIVVSIVCAFIIFFAVRLLGDDTRRSQTTKPNRAGGR